MRTIAAADFASLPDADTMSRLGMTYYDENDTLQYDEDRVQRFLTERQRRMVRRAAIASVRGAKRS